MKTQFTNGTWEIDGNSIFPTGKSYSIAIASNISPVDSKHKPNVERDANLKLIASAPLGLQVAIKTYVALLQTPSELWRIRNQEIYCELRDFISQATGYTSREVQEFYEEVAVLMKHDKLSFNEASKKVAK